MARVLLGVTGGIAAYKSVELVRLAIKAGHSVRVVQTPARSSSSAARRSRGSPARPVLVEEFERDPARGAFPGDPAPDHAAISHLELVAARRRLRDRARRRPTRSRSSPAAWPTTC